MLTVLATLALAQPVRVEPYLPVRNEIGAGAALLGGVDAWETGGGATGELQMGLGGSRIGPSTTWSGGYSGLVQGWAGPWALDAHLLRGEVQHGAGPRLAGALRGSGAQGWGEAQLEAGLRRQVGGVGVEVTAGPLLRTFALPLVDQDQANREWAPGAGLGAVARWSADPRWFAEVGGAVRAFAGPDLPHLVSAFGSLRWRATSSLTVATFGAATRTAGTGDAFVGGLPPAGTTVLRAGGEASWWAWPSVAVTVEGGPEVASGAIAYRRVRAVAGIRAALGRARASSPELPSGELELRVRLPDADRVEVLGGFTGWQPRPMMRDGDWFRLIVPVPPGVHEYVYLVDGEPLTPPEATQTRPDGFGGRNGVLIVGEPDPAEP